MMPSSSSSSDSEGGADLPRQAPTAGLMPPSDSEDEEEGGPAKPKAADKDEGEPSNATPQLTRKEQKALAADMERLALVRQRREEERQARIKAEGWDRFSPVSETNKPPVGLPKKREEEEEDEEEEDDDEEDSDDE